MADQSQKVTFANLTKRQINALSLFVNPEINTITEIADRAGVARKTIYSWLDKDEFKLALDKKIENFTDSEAANIWKSLINKALDGDTQAIKLYFELKNKYKQRTEISGPGGGAIEISAKEELEKAISRIASREEE